MTTLIKIPAVRGFQGSKPFYQAALSAGIHCSIVTLTDPSLPVSERAQRLVSEKDAAEIAAYMNSDPGYFLQTVDLAIAGEAEFESVPGHPMLGYLTFDASAEVYIDDGQTRTRGYALAIALNQAIAKQDVKLSIEVDCDLERRRKRFSVSNLNRRKVAKALSTYYSDDPEATISRLVVNGSETLFKLTELTEDTVKKNSDKLFSFNALHEATQAFLMGQEELTLEAQAQLAIRFWEGLIKILPDWKAVAYEGKPAKHAREGTIHHNAVCLVAIAKVGNQLLKDSPELWSPYLKGFRHVDWSRTNPEWQGTVIFDRSIKKNRSTIEAAAAIIRDRIGC